MAEQSWQVLVGADPDSIGKQRGRALRVIGLLREFKGLGLGFREFRV